MKTRAYSLLEIKSVDDERRIIEGIATTPNPDRMGDVIVTEGLEFKLPIPLLYQHDAKNPIGSVTSAKVQKDGITIKAQVAPGGVDQDVDKAWLKIKSGLVRGLSIGFRTLEESFDKTLGGFRILRSEWLELSAVTIPANAEATITSVKAFDLEAQPASGHRRGIVSLGSSSLPGVSGQTKKKSMTIQEQIVQWDNKLVSTKAQQDEIMDAATKAARTLEEEEQNQYDELDKEIEKITKHITLLKKREATMVQTANPVNSTTINSPETGKTARSGQTVISVKSMTPKGIGMARIAMALAGAKGNRFEAQNIVRERWPDSPELVDGIRAVVEAGDTTTSGWASQLVPNAVQTDFLELLRPMTIFGRIQGFRRVPFNVVVPIQSAGGTYTWVAEAAAKPVSALTFTSQTLRWGKVAGIIVITQELARFSSPSAEALVRDDMLEGLARYIDTQFVGSAAAVANVSPAGILNGIASTATSGTTAGAFRTDMNNMLNNFTSNNVDLGRITLLMSSTQALALSLMVTDLGVALFPNIGINGGSILGFPVIVSENVGSNIIGIDASQILVADDGGISIDVSTEASVEMSSTPIIGDTSPITGATLKSLWQNNLVGLRCEKFITWIAGRTAAVEYITGNAYVP